MIYNPNVFAPSGNGEGKMLNRPTVVPTVDPNGRLEVVPTDPYFSIKVSTKDRTEPCEVVLFDGSRGYQLGYNYLMPGDVIVTGITSHYQFMLNDLVHNGTYFDVVQMRVAPSEGNTAAAESLALSQFAYPIEVYYSSKGQKPRLRQTLYPDSGLHEGQYHKDINTFSGRIQLTNRTALVYRQEPDIDVIIKFYQKAEIGRQL